MQAQGLSVTGTVLGVTAQDRTWEETKSNHVFAIRVYLQFRNTEDYPVIIFKPGSYFLDRKVEFFDSYSGGPVDAFTVKYQSQYAHAGMVGNFSGAEPSKDLFVIIPAGGYYETGDVFMADGGYSTEEELVKNARGEPLKDNHGKETIRYSPPRSTRRYLRVQYHLSMKTEKDVSEKLDAARERWSKFGRILVSADGDYTVRSEMIVNIPPE